MLKEWQYPLICRNHNEFTAVVSTKRGAIEKQGTSDMTGAATVFTVRDMTKSIDHYCSALGFAITFQYGNPIFYTCLCRDEVALHLISAQQTKRPPGNGAV